MPSHWFARFGNAEQEKTAQVFEVCPDVAEAFIAGTRREIGVRQPRHAQDFGDLIEVIAQASRIVQSLDELREHAIAAADRTGPHADRKAMAIAAGFPPSRLYRVLEKHGQPRNRAQADPTQHDKE
jgi:hypothetical protein